MATSHRATNDPPVEDPKADAPAKAEVEAEAKVEAPAPEPTEAEKAKAERREAVAPVRSEFAQSGAGWAVDVTKVMNDADDAVAALFESYVDLMTKAPEAGDGPVQAHIARVRGALNDFARVSGQIRTVAGDLSAAAG